MPNEKMMILNMLQEGKISADEAAKLLSSVENAPTVAPSRASDPRSNDSARPAASERPAGHKPGVDFDELGRKFAAFAKDWEPKIQKATEIVAEKTVVIADKLSSALEAGAKSFESSVSKQTTAATAGGTGPSGGTERHIEQLVSEGYNELSLSALNANVTIKGYNGDKISARITYKAKRTGAAIDLIKLGGKYYLNYEEDDFHSVAIDAYVPSDKFQIANISGANGNIEISGLTGTQLQISGGNGRMRVTEMAYSHAVIEHYNGTIEAGQIDAEKLSITNFNGPVSMNMSDFARYDEYLWSIETSNAKLTLNVPSLPDLGYHIRASSALGNIRVGLTGLEFISNEPGMAEARSAGFDSRAKKVRLALETSNAALTVN